jgi:hypothetical protein
VSGSRSGRGMCRYEAVVLAGWQRRLVKAVQGALDTQLVFISGPMKLILINCKSSLLEDNHSAFPGFLQSYEA